MSARRADGAFDAIEAVTRSRGFWFPAPAARWDLFVFGVRAPVTSSNLFDDTIGVAYRVGSAAAGEARVEIFRGTTDPGRAALDHPTHPDGTATVIPGQVRKLWTRGLHRGRYPALVHRPEVVVPVYRGGDGTAHLDARGINLHHAGSAASRGAAARVDWYSAGCQVLLYPEDLTRVLELVGYQVRAGLGGYASYTLFDARETPELAGLLP